MSMNNKYYTPSIEEFHVGFEYEWKCNGTQTNWSKSTCDILMNPLDVDCRRINEYRVKYLDTEDIESLGFESQNSNKTLFANSEYEIQYHNNIIQIDRYYLSPERLFKGIIKNKSELKRLLKQLNIS